MTVGGKIIYVKPGCLSLSKKMFSMLHSSDIMHDNVAYIKSSTGQMVSGKEFSNHSSLPPCLDNVMKCRSCIVIIILYERHTLIVLYIYNQNRCSLSKFAQLNGRILRVVYGGKELLLCVL